MNKTLWWVVGVLVVIVLIVVIIKWPRNGQVSPGDTSSPYVSSTNSPYSGVGPSGTTENTVYDALVAQYADARIQFDMYCQAIPNRVVVKNGAAIMFDNRSGDARNIAINGTTYQFPGYGYWVIPLSSSTLPETIMLDCGSAVNVGTIVIEQ